MHAPIICVIITRVRTGHGNPGKSWISNLVKSRPGNPKKGRQVMENPGKLALCTNKIKLLSQVLANANVTCLISYSRTHAYIPGDWLVTVWSWKSRGILRHRKCTNP